MRSPAHPGLYRADSETPALTGTRCARCSFVMFPPIVIGCERCGAWGEQLQPATLSTAGTVHSFAVVHAHFDKPDPPFTVAEVLLADGPLIHAMVAPEATVAIGDAVSAHWLVSATNADGAEIVEPVFAPTDPHPAAQEMTP